MASNHTVQIRITAQNMSDPAFRSLVGDLNQVGTASQQTSKQLSTIGTSASGAGSALAGIGRTAVGVAGGLGLANAAIGVLGRGFGFVKSAVFDTNRTMEETRATLLALTKDGAQTERMMARINEVASKTPFTFDQVAQSYTSLLPVANQYRMELDELVEVSQLLAASNPAEGLEGAAFALREALSGDYTSLIERFNLSRQAINDLKEQGVPALEIVRQSMQGLGIDAELLARRAETSGARWTTFFDNLRLDIAEAGKPIFDTINTQGLAAAEAIKSEIGSAITDVGTIAQGLRDIVALSPIQILVELTGDADALDFIRMFYGVARLPDRTAGRLVVGGADAVSAIKDAYDGMIDSQRQTAELTHENTSAFQQFVDNAIQGSGYVVESQDAINQMAEEYHFRQQQLEDGARRVAEAERDRDNAAAAGAERRTAGQDNEARSLADQAAMREYAADTLRRQNMETLDYVSTLDAEAEAAYHASEANSTLLVTQDRLADVYQQGLQAQQDYTQQGAEYASQASNIEKALDIVNQKVADGVELTEQEIFIRDHATEALGRYAGGQQDAALTAGEYAIRNGMVMQAQDELNAALGRGEISQEEYAQKMRDAYAAAGLTYDATANNSTIMGTMASTIATQLVPAILDLIAKLDAINGKHVTTTVETRFITTGDPATGQMYGQSVSGTTVGLTERAAGGIIDRPQLALIGEEAPSHPEFIIPTNPSRRGRAVGLWAAAGRSLGIPGFADGGGPGGGGTASAPGSLDWSWLFAGLDVEAENYTSRAADAFEGLFRDIEDLASGDAMQRAQAELDRLLTIRQIAIDTGAGEAVVAGLDAEIADQQGRVQAIGAAMGTDIVVGIREQMQSADLAAALAEDIQRAWDGALRDLDSILSGEHEAKLQDTLRDLETMLALALAGGAPEDVINGLRENIAAVQRELAATQTIFNEALEAGLVNTDPFEIPLDRIAELLPQMRDGGLSMIDELVAGVADGSTNLSGVMALVNQMIDADSDEWEETIGASANAIQDELLSLRDTLLKDIAGALAEGSDPSVFQANLAIIEALLADVSQRAVETSDVLRNLVTGQIIKGPAGMRVGGGGSRQTIEQAAGQVGGRAISLYMPSGALVGQWYAGYAAEQDMLSPVSIGGLV